MNILEPWVISHNCPAKIDTLVEIWEIMGECTEISGDMTHTEACDCLG